jgi:hypothetical protein
VESGDGQRWAPSAYNPRALGVLLEISGHRTDLVQEISELDRERAHTERVEVADRADRVDCLQYPAEIERVSGAIGAPNVTRCIPIKLKYCDFSLQSSRLCTKL